MDANSASRPTASAISLASGHLSRIAGGDDGVFELGAEVGGEGWHVLLSFLCWQPLLYGEEASPNLYQSIAKHVPNRKSI
jgi:hypothetical protein